MNPYERMMLVLEGKRDELDRIPCACACVGSYTIEFMEKYDAYWPDAHKDPEKMARLGSAAYRECGVESVVVPFDAVYQPEILGLHPDFREKQIKKGKILWPSVYRQGFRKDGTEIKDPSDLLFPEDIASAGRIPVITKALKILHEEFYGEVPVCTGIGAPFTLLAGYILDTVKFMTMVMSDIEKVRAFYEAMMPQCIELVKIFFEAGADVVRIAEDGASCDNLSPSLFDRFIKPYLIEMFRKSGAQVLTMSGSAGPIIKSCVETGAKMIVIDEKTNVGDAKKVIDSMKPEYNMALAGNLPTMGLLKRGPEEKIREYVRDIIEQGVDVVSPGSDFWIKTPSKNIRTMVEATKEFGVIRR
ncbi:MAG: uroporphyrinogen decarboxylase family protein [Candidatus Syntropharchaeia archaeon]